MTLKSAKSSILKNVSLYEKLDALAMGYFRAILKKEEISDWALQCTEELVMVNPGCYTAWHWWWKCIQELSWPELWT